MADDDIPFDGPLDPAREYFTQDDLDDPAVQARFRAEAIAGCQALIDDPNPAVAHLRESFLAGLERTVARAEARLARVVESEARRQRERLKLISGSK
jgi:hypothetical protein